MKIGIAITTRNRKEVLAETLKRLERYLPSDCKVVVVDDASDEPVGFADYRFEKNVGIPRAKNKCLELLYNAGCEHIFLFDDDTYPIADNWWKPYVEHKEPHLMLQFKLKYKPPSDMREVYRDDTVVAYSHTRGAMLYVERRVLDVVGGFDTAYGLGGFEHPDWSNRIHNAGLTTYRAMDIPKSNRLLYCLDKDNLTKTTLKQYTNQKLANVRHYRESRYSSEYKEFRNE